MSRTVKIILSSVPYRNLYQGRTFTSFSKHSAEIFFRYFACRSNFLEAMQLPLNGMCSSIIIKEATLSNDSGKRGSH